VIVLVVAMMAPVKQIVAVRAIGIRPRSAHWLAVGIGHQQANSERGSGC
jgi:hypothetical protein